MRSPGTLRWMSDFGSRSATIDGASSPARRSAIVKVLRSRRVQRHPARDPAELVAGALDEQPAGLRGARTWCATHPATSASSYCRSTLRARMTAARRPSGSGTSNPPSRKLTPGRAAARRDPHPLRVDLDADDLDVGPHRAQPLVQLEARRRGGAVAEVDDERVVGAPQHGQRGDPAVDAAQPVGAGRAAGDPPLAVRWPGAIAPILTWLG